MSLLDTIETPHDRPIIATISGDAGSGKTTLASLFPRPIFIRAEDGMQSIPPEKRPDAFPILKNTDQLFDQLIALLREPHEYRTLVIDSVTALERMFIAEVLKSDPKAKSINSALGGYGAGMSHVAESHARIRKAAGYLNSRRGMNVVFIAHADVEKMSLPDMDDYQRYSLRLSAKSLPPYVDDVDLVGFVRLSAATSGAEGERKRVISTGSRELIVAANVASVSKNRFGITKRLELRDGINPLLDLIPQISAEPVAESPTDTTTTAATTAATATAEINLGDDDDE